MKSLTINEIVSSDSAGTKGYCTYNSEMMTFSTSCVQYAVVNALVY
jgi:hypothetical protein